MRKILIAFLLLGVLSVGRGDCAVLIGFGSESQGTPTLSIKTGYYTGNGTSQSISVGFQPDFIIIVNNSSYNAVVRFGTQGTGDAAFDAVAYTAAETGIITSISSSGYDVGADDRTNHNGSTYYWTAFKDNGAGDMSSDSFTGDGNVKTISSLGFDPAIVFAKPDTATATSALGFKTTAVPSNNTLLFDDYGYGAGKITSLGTDEFTLGAYYSVNEITTHYVAFKAISGKIAAGSYVGNGGSNSISVSGFSGITPDSVIVKLYAEGGTWDAISRFNGMGSNISCRSIAAGTLTTGIVSLDVGGFTLGTSAGVNSNTYTYHYLVFKAD